jgi:hypothetical protein
MPASDGSWNCKRCTTSNSDDSDVCSNCSEPSVDPDSAAWREPGLTPDHSSIASSPAVSHMSYSDDEEDDYDEDDYDEDDYDEDDDEDVDGDVEEGGEQEVGEPHVVGSDVDDNVGDDDDLGG